MTKKDGRQPACLRRAGGRQSVGPGDRAIVIILLQLIRSTMAKGLVIWKLPVSKSMMVWLSEVPQVLSKWALQAKTTLSSGGTTICR